MADEGYDLKWKNHLTDVFGVVRLIRGRETFSDVILFCDGKQFLAHKVILAACSTFFERMLSVLPSEKAKVLVMTDTDSEMLDLLLKFMYTGEAYVESTLLDDFMKTAERLEIRGLRKNDDDGDHLSGSSKSRKRPAPAPAPVPAAPSSAVKSEDGDQNENGNGERESEGGSEEDSRDDGVDPLAKRPKTVAPSPAKKAVPKLPPNVTLEAASPSSSNVKPPLLSKPLSLGLQVTPTKRKLSEIARPGPSGVQLSQPTAAAHAQQEDEDDIVEIDEGGDVKNETQEEAEEYDYTGEEWAEGEGEAYEEGEGEYYGEEGSEEGGQFQYDPNLHGGAGGSDERPDTIPPEISTSHPVTPWKPGTHSWKGFHTLRGGPAWFCGICGYTSFNSEHTVRHARVHTGLRPFVCGLCGKSFARADTLRIHEKGVHGPKNAAII